MPKFSVIVPVYKVEKYLDKCITSILNQTYVNFECVLIDDGSPDNCGKICDKYAEADSRIRVIHKENGGLSSARNAGIDSALGEYIVFVDSDDYIDKRMLEDISAEISFTDSDIVLFGVKIEREGNTEERIFKKADTHIVKKKILSGDWEAWACNKVFKSKLLKYNKFPKGLYFEDLYIIPEICLQAERITVIEKSYYHYNNDNMTSITRKANSKKWYDYFWAKKRNLDVATEQGFESDVSLKIERQCIELGKKCIFSYFNDDMLNKEQFDFTKEYLKQVYKGNRISDKRNIFWIKQILAERVWLCKFYAKIRGY